MANREHGLRAVERELVRFPVGVIEEFRRALHRLEGLVSADALQAWAQEGLAIARQTVRSWETAAEYYRVSPEVVPYLSLQDLITWARWGHELCGRSPAIGTAYFRASPAVLPCIRPRMLPQWAGTGARLYRGTWKSSTLAVRYFEVSPSLLRSLTYPQMERFTLFVEAIAQRSYDLAGECLTLGAEAFPRLQDCQDAFLRLLEAMVDSAWREVKGAFDAVVRALPRVQPEERTRFLRLATDLARHGYPEVARFLQEASLALGQVPPEHHKPLLDLADSLLPRHPSAVPEFLRNAPRVLERLSLPQLTAWFQEGLRILHQNPDGGLAFFRLESARAEQALDAFACSVELERVKEVLRLYCRALAGTSVEIAPTRSLVEKNIGWVSAEKPTTEGTTIYLPTGVDRYPSKEQNFLWYKVLATHQVAHLEFGSFRFVFDRPSVHFRDLRPRLWERLQARGDAQDTPLTEMQRFFRLFPDRRLALDLFTVLEDARLDRRVLEEYRGIRPVYRQVQRDALAERPDLRRLPAREALVECLVRLSLDPEAPLEVPASLVPHARALARILRRLLRPGATVEDTAEATLRAYAVVSSVPNEDLEEERMEPVDPEGSEEEPEEWEDLLEQMGQPRPGQQDPGEGAGQEYRSPQEVLFRGDFKPELSQLLARLKEIQQEQKAQAGQASVSREMLEQMLAQSADLEIDALKGDITTATRLFANNLMREAGMTPPPDTPQFHRGPLLHTEDEGGPLEAREPDTYVYDEWDFRADDYKPRWCIVREKGLMEGDISFWYGTLQAYAPLVAQIRRQFEMVVPEAFRKVKRLKDGEEFELDAVIEAMVDRRAGITPSEKLYWRRNKVERDVAVVFLLDMSASTAEAIEEGRREEPDVPDDPVEYMLWLRARRAEVPRRSYKRIIDLEKESTVLLIQALEALGDRYGIYGFSGYGRENVEFYRIKDINEALTDRVKRRIDKITPLHATRMGPAIRHAITKLERVDAKTKVLFLISDGRPQDRGYSREGVEREYAVHDTRMALLEARRKSIIPFCLTVDRQGHDYLKAMCGDMGYEVLGDIYALPSRLLYLYRKLTV